MDIDVKIKNPDFLDSVIDILIRNIDYRLVKIYIQLIIKDKMTTDESLLYLDISLKSYNLFDTSNQVKYLKVFYDISSKYNILYSYIINGEC